MPLALNVIQHCFLRERAKKRAKVLLFFGLTKYFCIFCTFFSIYGDNVCIFAVFFIPLQRNLCAFEKSSYKKRKNEYTTDRKTISYIEI